MVPVHCYARNAVRTDEFWISASLQYSSLLKLLSLCMSKVLVCLVRWQSTRGDASLMARTQVIFLMRRSALLLLKIRGVWQSKSYESPFFATEGKRSSENKSTQLFFRTVCSCKLGKVFPVEKVLTYHQIGF